MYYTAYIQYIEILEPKKNNLSNLILLYIVVVSHHSYIFLFTLSLPFLFIKAPWYISIPLLSWYLNAAFGDGWICPWTALENNLRKSVGYPQINAFIRHYYIKPYMRIKIKIRKRSANRNSLAR